MFKAPYLVTLTLALIAFTGCIVPGARLEKAEIELQRNDSLFVIDEGDFRFRIVLPKDLMIAHEPTIQHNEMEKTVSIICGPSFHIIAELSNTGNFAPPTQEGIFQLDIIDSEDYSVVFKRLLPNGNIHDYGLIQETEMNGVRYVFQSDSFGEYSLDDVLRMKSALASVKI